jgi:hypothetical protein
MMVFSWLFSVAWNVSDRGAASRRCTPGVALVEVACSWRACAARRRHYLRRDPRAVRASRIVREATGTSSLIARRLFRGSHGDAMRQYRGSVDG